jgi:hypothetical protein
MSQELIALFLLFFGLTRIASNMPNTIPTAIIRNVSKSKPVRRGLNLSAGKSLSLIILPLVMKLN